MQEPHLKALLHTLTEIKLVKEIDFSDWNNPKEYVYKGAFHSKILPD
jgi:hypothetical protein